MAGLIDALALHRTDLLNASAATTASPPVAQLSGHSNATVPYDMAEPHVQQPVPQPIRTQGPATLEDPHRERFDAFELALVLSHYDLGVIEQLRTYPRGSRRSPKLRIKSRRGEFLLKRRAPGHDDPYRVAFAHDLQLHLESRGYPVPGLVGTRTDNNSMLQLNGRAYELFNYIYGGRYERTSAAAQQVGAMLGTLHLMLSEYRSLYDPPVGSFHAAPEIDAKLALIPPAIRTVEPQIDPAALTATVEFLRRAYHDAAARVIETGFPEWPRTILHGDWHPGNLLYRDGRIVSVLDFDSARTEPRVVDLANAMLQFSIQMAATDDLEVWPDGLDVNLIRCIVRGYDETCGAPLTREERAALPWLIVEALIIESIVPIAATGSFARLSGSAFLRMVERKVRWIRPRAAKLVEFLKE